MNIAFSKLKQFFSSSLHTLPRRTSNKNNLVFCSGQVSPRIISMLLENQLKYCKLEYVKLDKVLTTYRLFDALDVTIGIRGDEYYYIVSEPEINDQLIERVASELAERILKGVETSPRLGSFLGSQNMGPAEYIYFKLVSGFGPLTPFILDPHIEDIHLSSISERVYVVHNKFSWIGWLKTNVLVDPAMVDRLVLSISRRIGKHVSLVQPLAEGSVEGLIRASLAYGSSVSPLGSSIVLRKKSGGFYTITRLINDGVLPSHIAAYLWLVIENKGWIIIAGHVGSGKTTLLQALLGLVPVNRKVVTIEDSPEVSTVSRLWDSLVESSETYSRSPQIDAFTLLKFALRRRSDYVVIGEVRGIEARLLVQASRLGHGVINTIHADSAQSVLERLTAPPISIPRNLLNNIWTIVVMEQDGKTRKVSSVTEVDTDVSLIEIYSNQADSTIKDVVARSTRLLGIYDGEALYREMVKRAVFLERLVSSGVFSPEALADHVLRFYEDGGLDLGKSGYESGG